jgi:hypothetical protein
VSRPTDRYEFGGALVGESYEFERDVAFAIDKRAADVRSLEFFVHELFELSCMVCVIHRSDDPEGDNLVGNKACTYLRALSTGESDRKGKCAKALFRTVDSNHDARQSHGDALPLDLERIANVGATSPLRARSQHPTYAW